MFLFSKKQYIYLYYLGCLIWSKMYTFWVLYFILLQCCIACTKVSAITILQKQKILYASILVHEYTTCDTYMYWCMKYRHTCMHTCKHIALHCHRNTCISSVSCGAAARTQTSLPSFINPTRHTIPHSFSNLNN